MPQFPILLKPSAMGAENAPVDTTQRTCCGSQSPTFWQRTTSRSRPTSMEMSLNQRTNLQLASIGRLLPERLEAIITNVPSAFLYLSTPRSYRDLNKHCA